MRRQVEHPFRARARDGLRNRSAVLEVGRMQPHVGAQGLDAPRVLRAAEQEMDLMAVAQESARQVGADETGSAGDQDAFAHPRKRA